VKVGMGFDHQYKIGGCLKGMFQTSMVFAELVI